MNFGNGFRPIALSRTASAPEEGTDVGHTAVSPFLCQPGMSENSAMPTLVYDRNHHYEAALSLHNPSCHALSTLLQSPCGHLRERLSCLDQNPMLAHDLVVATQNDVNVERIKLKTPAAATSLLGRDQCRAGP